MPSKSQAQRHLMNAAAHNPAFAKKVGIDQEVAQEFHEADKEQPDKKLPEKVKGKSTNESLVRQWSRGRTKKE